MSTVPSAHVNKYVYNKCSRLRKSEESFNITVVKVKLLQVLSLALDDC